MEPSSSMLIFRVADDAMTECEDEIAAEATFTLIVNDETLVSLLCTPAELDAMAVGFLLSEGFITEPDSLLSVAVDESTFTVKVIIKNLPRNWQEILHRKTITSGCGQGITYTDAGDLHSVSSSHSPITWLTPAFIRELLRDFRDISILYKRTGGVHSAALADATGIILFAEDIGRHNAVDKLIGKAFLTGISVEDKILLSSGRISGEIMTKVIRNRLPVLVSRTAPTCMSITHAEDNGVTLIGFARGNRMNIYTHPLRVTYGRE